MSCTSIAPSGSITRRHFGVDALHAVQRYHSGETLEQRLRRPLRLSLAAGPGIGIRLSEGDARTDLYALGVALCRAWSGAYPYGEVEPFQRKSFGRPVPLSRHRPDLPPWLGAVPERAVAVRPDDRRTT